MGEGAREGAKGAAEGGSGGKGSWQAEHKAMGSRLVCVSCLCLLSPLSPNTRTKKRRRRGAALALLVPNSACFFSHEQAVLADHEARGGRE